MKAVSKDTIEIGDARYSRIQLENALSMLDNYQPPAPVFKAGDIVERTEKGILEGKQFLVIGKGPTKDVLVTEYRDVTQDAQALVVTDGYTVWTDQKSVNFKKIGSLIRRGF